MASMKTLEFYKNLHVKNNHFRYMSQQVKDELIAMTSGCVTDSLAERMMWYQEHITEYPKCKGCEQPLTSANFYPSASKEQKASGWAQKGYRPFCGKTCAMRSDEKRLATEKTSLAKYGTKHVLSSLEVQTKRKLTNKKRYGAETPHPWGSLAHQKILQAKYGVSFARHIPGVHEAAVNTIHESTKKRLPEKIDELEKLFAVQLMTPLQEIEVGPRMYDLELAWKHSCGSTYTSNISERGLRMCPRCSASTSRAERYLGDLLESHDVEVLRRDTKTLGVEVDLWIPSKRVAIEFDGTYWHSARFVSRQKAMKKLELARDVGVQLITVQEHLWEFKQALVEARLLNIIGVNQQRLGARKLGVRFVNATEANAFFNSTHLQGAAGAQHTVALFHNDELQACMSFAKPRFSTKADWELVRFSSLPGLTIQGGASKLLSAFRAKFSGSILSYADRCWSTGALYQALGFKLLHENAPSYFWVSGKQGIYSRYQTQKKKLPKLLGSLGFDFDITLTEEENMSLAKFLKVYDRGTSAWILKQ